MARQEIDLTKIPIVMFIIIYYSNYQDQKIDGFPFIDYNL
jgi:hypothetical protein